MSDALQTFLDENTARFEQLANDLKASFAVSNRRWLTVDEAGEYVGLSTKTIARLIAEDKLKASHPVGGASRIDRQQLDQYMLASQRKKSTRGRSAAG